MSRPAGRLETVAGRPVLRLERVYPHPPAKVWRAVTDPAALAQWFPATVETELRAGAEVTFRFEGDDTVTHGEVLQVQPPSVFCFSWNDDVLRFELTPVPEGCRLVFTHTMGGGWAGRLGAARNAAGWEVCLDGLEAVLAARVHVQPTDWLERLEARVDDFGLAEGEVRTSDGQLVTWFARDLMWRPLHDIWSLLTQDAPVATGQEPPVRFTNAAAPPGRVLAVDAPHLLEYAWLDGDAEAGRVRFTLVEDARTGTRVEVSQTLPERRRDRLPIVLATWQVHLELLFAALMGEVRPWPGDRVDALERRYRTRLEASAG